MCDLFEAGVPGVIRNIGPLFESAEVFAWIKAAHEPSRADVVRNKLAALRQTWGVDPPGAHDDGPNPGREVDLYLEGKLVLGSSRYLPTTEQDFETWVARTREQLGGGSFGMQAPGLECASWAALHRLRALLGPVLAITGPRSFRYNAFAGDYRRTPFGFHVDPHHEGVFQYVLCGPRRGLFWNGLKLSAADSGWMEDADARHRPGRPADYEVDLQPGDLVYWPGSYAHGFEADGPSMALSMVVDRASPRRREAVVADLEVATLGGAAALPRVDETVALDAGDVVQRAHATALAYERYDDTLIVGVCGRTFDWPDFPSTRTAIRLLDHLRTQERIEVAEVAATFADETLSRADICGVLSMLGAMGLFHSLPSPTSAR